MWYGRTLKPQIYAYRLPHACLVGNLLHYSKKIAISQCLNALVIMTTIQAQDFQDIDRDKIVGRYILPMACPTISRTSMLLLIPTWSIFLSLHWRPDIHRTPHMRKPSVSENNKSYELYNVRDLYIFNVHHTTNLSHIGSANYVVSTCSPSFLCSQPHRRHCRKVSLAKVRTFSELDLRYNMTTINLIYTIFESLGGI